MEIFGLIMCFVILIAIQHIGNWLVRKAWYDDEPGLAVLVFLILLAMTYGLSYVIINYLQTHKL